MANQVSSHLPPLKKLRKSFFLEMKTKAATRSMLINIKLNVSKLLHHKCYLCFYGTICIPPAPISLL